MIEYKLINGDCLEEMRKMPDGCIDVVFTSPPITIRAFLKATRKTKDILNTR